MLGVTRFSTRKADIVMELCDRCSMAAQDEGAGEFEEIMFEMGADVADHLCDAREEPNCGILCDCRCSRTLRREMELGRFVA